jgi:hypothetical protein
VSEPDFFFDDEPETPNPATKAPKAPKAASSSSKGAASKPAASKPAASKPAPTKKPAAVVEEPVESFADQPTTWAIASLIGVCGLLLGLILGFLLGTTLTKNATLATSATSATPAITAPAAVSGGGSTLTTAQLSSGQLPAGHPKITVPTSTTP